MTGLMDSPGWTSPCVNPDLASSSAEVTGTSYRAWGPLENFSISTLGTCVHDKHGGAHLNPNIQDAEAGRFLSKALVYRMNSREIENLFQKTKKKERKLQPQRV